MNYPSHLKKLLNTAIKEGASDLHLSVGHKPALRITKTLADIESEPVLTADDSEGLAFCLMTDQQREKFLREKDIDFGYNFEAQARFRVNVFFQSGKISVALRLVPAKIRTAEELALPSISHDFAAAQQGLVLITGASSQGKSTTLAALIDEINHKRREHIITIEDPIEYVFHDDKSIIDQRELHQDTFSFARALRAALREDPNVIMVGEMRDLETISTALTAAETGHLVLATLHTNSASQTIHRIVDVFPAHQQNQIRAQLAGALLGVMSQRLLPRVQNGFVPGCEVMLNIAATANLIRENKIHELPSVIETSREVGMFSLNQSLSEFVKSGEVSEETALKYSLFPQDLVSRLAKIKI